MPQTEKQVSFLKMQIQLNLVVALKHTRQRSMVLFEEIIVGFLMRISSCFSSFASNPIYLQNND